MFIALKVSEANKSIYHTRKNGEFVKKIFREDADYEIENYLIFIIDVNKGEILKYDDEEVVVNEYFWPQRSNIYSHSCIINLLFKSIVNNGKEIPQKIDLLIKDNLHLLFEGIIKIKGQGYDNSKTWKNYFDILKYQNKFANDYVPQEKIDRFFNAAIKAAELEQIEKMLEGGLIILSKQNKILYESLKKKIIETIEIVKGNLQTKKDHDIICTANSGKMFYFPIEGTPFDRKDDGRKCQVKITLNNNNNYINYIIYVPDDYDYSMLDITKYVL